MMPLGFRHSPETIARMRAAALRRYADPEVRARHAAAMADPEVRARKSAAMKLAWADPEVRARHAAAMADPEVRARHAAAMADPEVRARKRQALDWLADEERAQVVAAIRAGAAYIDIAKDWLLSTGRVRRIAIEEGLHVPRRRKAAAEEARP